MKFGDGFPKFLTFRDYNTIHEEMLPPEVSVTQSKLHQRYIESTIMRILLEIHGMVTPLTPEILFEEERKTWIYQNFTPQETEVLRRDIGLPYINRNIAVD